MEFNNYNLKVSFFAYVAVMLMLIISLSSANSYPYEGAYGEICFNVSGDETLWGYENTPNWYSMATISLNKSTAEWSDNLASYHVEDATDEYLFKLGENSTHVFIIIPVRNNILPSASDRYCIYVGDDDKSSLMNSAPQRAGFATSAEYASMRKENQSAYTASWSSNILTLNSSSGNGIVVMPGDIYTTSQDIALIVKMKYVNNAGTDTSVAGGWLRYLDFDSNGYGMGIRGSNTSYGFYNENNSIGSANDSWYVYRIDMDWTQDAAVRVYDENLSLIYSVNDTSVASDCCRTDKLSLAYVRESEAQFDYAVAYRGMTSGYDFQVTDVTYDIQDYNITILSPVNNYPYTTDDNIIFRVQYNNDYDNCSYYINDDYWMNYTNITTGTTKADAVSNALLDTGSNNISVYCNANATYRVVHFSRTVTDIEDLFDDIALNLSGICTSDTIEGLGACFESYNLSSYYDFGAVICKDLNLSKSYDCLSGVGNFTKNNYTIYYNPTTWNYDTNEEIEHIGAIFYYEGADMETRIEIYDDDKFMYAPAQDKIRDCDIWYDSNTQGCSWWNGFIRNDGHVIISDKSENWYIAGGSGFVNYDINYSQLVIPISLLPIVQSGETFLTDGVYIRHNCFQSGNNYIINLRNTEQKTYAVSVIGNESSSYTFQSTTLFDNITLSGVNEITVTDEDRRLCTYTEATTLFLPFSVDVLDIDGYNILIWLLYIFTMILSAIVPFALFIPLMLNDAYQLVPVGQMAMFIVFAGIAALINNSNSQDRGIKHIVILTGIVVAYLTVLADYDDQLGVDLSQYENTLGSFADMVTSNNLWDFVFNLFSFIINLFQLIIGLPIMAIDLIRELVFVLSPPIHTIASPFLDGLKIVMVLWLFIKAYETITNKFREV